jgi:hypothetical protein
MDTEIAFIIGNGTSRKPIDLYSLVGKGTIYGCNALYRSFNNWDYLVAIDDGMIDELIRINFENGEVIIPPLEERFESAEYSPNRRRSNAGMNAMLESIRRGAKFLYCLGFDFILDGDISVDNIYKNTANYGPETHANISDNYYRIKYLEWFIGKYPEVTFIFVVPNGANVKRVDGKNVIGMSIDSFIKKVN